MTVYASIGSISNCTLREADLLTAFANELEQLTSDFFDELEQDTIDDNRQLVNDARACLDDRGELLADEQLPDPEEPSGCIGALIDALESFAPPYCYFGGREDDGADFGFWIGRDSLRDGIYHGDVMQMNAGDDVLAELRIFAEDKARLPDHIMSMTDHGNVTLYSITDVKLTEIWSVV